MSGEELIGKAMKARKQAYAPYSGYRVGSCVEDEEGNLYTGCNIENASYGASMCAERVALFKLVSAGRRAVRRVAVATEDGAAPCGLCLQALSEFNPEGDIMTIYCAAAGGTTEVFTLKELLPVQFRLVAERKTE